MYINIQQHLGAIGSSRPAGGAGACARVGRGADEPVLCADRGPPLEAEQVCHADRLERVHRGGREVDAASSVHVPRPRAVLWRLTEARRRLRGARWPSWLPSSYILACARPRAAASPLTARRRGTSGTPPSGRGSLGGARRGRCLGAASEIRMPARKYPAPDSLRPGGSGPEANKPRRRGCGPVEFGYSPRDLLNSKNSFVTTPPT